MSIQFYDHPFIVHEKYQRPHVALDSVNNTCNIRVPINILKLTQLFQMILDIGNVPTDIKLEFTQ